MFFASDNWAGAHPAISAALAAHGDGFAAAYGNSEIDRETEKRFSEIFEHDVSVWFLPTGTAANSLALAAVNRPGGVTFAHPDAHVREDEGGAPEFLSPGVRVRPVPGGNGKLDPLPLRDSVAAFSPGSVNMGRAMAVSITQATEIGTVYKQDEVAAISEVCREHGLPLHMDGARFANALVTLGCSPADMTWKKGVDMLSFGGTKNGCWCAEALVFFNRDLAAEMPWLRKRAGMLFSKNRFIAAQFLAYFDNGLWLELAGHANAMAAALADAIRASNKTRLAWTPEANEVFAVLKKADFERCQKAGVYFHDWPEPAGIDTGLGEDEIIARMVASFATRQDHIDRFAETLGG